MQGFVVAVALPSPRSCSCRGVSYRWHLSYAYPARSATHALRKAYLNPPLKYVKITILLRVLGRFLQTLGVQVSGKGQNSRVTNTYPTITEPKTHSKNAPTHKSFLTHVLRQKHTDANSKTSGRSRV